MGPWANPVVPRRGELRALLGIRGAHQSPLWGVAHGRAPLLGGRYSRERLAGVIFTLLFPSILPDGPRSRGSTTPTPEVLGVTSFTRVF